MSKFGKHHKRLSKAQRAAMARAEKAADESKQPRLSGKSPKMLGGTSWAEVADWVVRGETLAPAYNRDNKARDEFMRAFVRLEPHLNGVLSGACSINANRGWTLTGGRNVVNRTLPVLHGFTVAKDLRGWRPGLYATSEAYYLANIGSITELGRQDNKDGPVSRLYYTDSARCDLLGDGDSPLRYWPYAGGLQHWRTADYFRTVSAPATDESYNGLGFCAVSRAFELAKIMVGVLFHDQETLAVRAPKGLLLLKGIKQEQWDTAMKSRKENLEGDGWRFYEGVAVLASMLPDIDAKLVALSQLPANFTIEKFVEILMYGYALSFGFDPSEFWPLSGGSLGRGRETDIQHRKAVHKGARDFTLAFQENLMSDGVLPESVLFEFKERDVEGEIADAELAALKLKQIKEAYESGSGGQANANPLISWEEARQLMVTSSIIPAEWTEAEETQTEDDTGNKMRKERLLSNHRVRRALSESPNEPIITYSWPNERETVLWESGSSALKRRAFPGASVPRVLAKANGYKLTAEALTYALAVGRERSANNHNFLKARIAQ